MNESPLDKAILDATIPEFNWILPEPVIKALWDSGYITEKNGKLWGLGGWIHPENDRYIL